MYNTQFKVVFDQVLVTDYFCEAPLRFADDFGLRKRGKDISILYAITRISLHSLFRREKTSTDLLESIGDHEHSTLGVLEHVVLVVWEHDMSDRKVGDEPSTLLPSPLVIIDDDCAT